MTALSVLDLAPVKEGGTVHQALQEALDLAQHAERLGYTRYWVAEHHNMRGIASSATAVLIGHLAGGTRTIRVGAGGIMLPNHAPLMVAEQFGTLAALYPGRIDLGLGRAPGTDGLTAQALRRTLRSDPEKFPNDVVELRDYFKPYERGQRVCAVPGNGENVPIYILGSSLFGAQVAAILGMPFAFASHFAPAAMMQAMDIYRERFQPSEQLDKPYVILGYNICAADTDEEAHFHRSASLQAFLNLRLGNPGPLPRPVEGLEEKLGAQERQLLSQVSSASAVGSPDTVRMQTHDFIKQTGADELIIVGQIFDHEARKRSYEIAMEVCGDL